MTFQVKYGKNRKIFGKTASLYQKTTASGKINCKFAADKLAKYAKYTKSIL